MKLLYLDMCNYGIMYIENKKVMVSTVSERATYLNVLQNKGRGQEKLYNLWS